MKPHEEEIVTAGCAKVLADEHGLRSPRKTAAGCAAWLEREVSSYSEAFRDARRGRRRGRKERDANDLHYWLCELAAAVYTDMILMADFRVKHHQHVFWDAVDPPFRDAGFRLLLFQTMCSQMCNYLLSAAELARRGMDLQLLVLFRAQVELSETLLVCAGDHEFFGVYASQLHNESPFDYREWNRTLSPRVIRGKLDAIVRKLEVDADIATELHSRRAETYEWLSGHHHGHPLALLVRTYDERGATLGGAPGEETTSILRKLEYQTFESLSLLESLLARLHGWTMDPRKSFCRDVMFRWRAYRSIARELMTREDGPDETAQAEV